MASQSPPWCFSEYRSSSKYLSSKMRNYYSPIQDNTCYASWGHLRKINETCIVDEHHCCHKRVEKICIDCKTKWHAKHGALIINIRNRELGKYFWTSSASDSAGGHRKTRSDLDLRPLLQPTISNCHISWGIGFSKSSLDKGFGGKEESLSLWNFLCLWNFWN